MSDLVGRVLGQYEIVAELGHGGMGNVYRATQRSVGREVAIKVLPAHLMQDRTFLERFDREVKVIASLQHPRILPVHDYGEADGLPYIVMTYAPGGTLADRIKQSPSGIPLAEASRLVTQIAEGMDYAHEQGIIHRDFKPSNVLLDQKNNVYLADFGIAKVTADASNLTGSGSVGTPAYMAPEMSREGGLTRLVDVYALGVTLFEMLTGRHPFKADTPIGVLMAHATEPIPDIRAAAPHLPDGIQGIIKRAMSKDPKPRYQTAGGLAADLARAAGLPTATDQSPMSDVDDGATQALPSTPAPTRRRRLAIPAWGWVVVGLIVVAGVAGAWLAFPSVVQLGPDPGLTLALAGVTSNKQWTPRIQEFEGVKMALVPAGCFMMGSADGEDNEKPVNKQCFKQPFWIDVTEVTNAQIKQFNGQIEHTGYWTDDNRPRGSVSWNEATAFCAKRGARLPTEPEWEYAARGPDNLVYPWGNDFVAENVNTSGSGSEDVGSHPAGASWVGALDLTGNLSEWVSTWYAPYPYDPTDGREAQAGLDKFKYHPVRGGSWINLNTRSIIGNREAAYADSLRATIRNVAWYATYQDNQSGFRCARAYP